MVQVPPETTPETVTDTESPARDSQPYSSTRSATQPQSATREHSRPKAQKTLPPLSPITYYRRNMARTLPIGGAIVISCFLIAAIVTLLNSVDRSITTHYGLTRRFSVLTSQLERTVSSELVQRVQKDPNLSRAIVVTPTGNNIRTVFGQLPVPIYGVDASEMQMAIEASGNRLVEGRLPRPNTPEVVMTRLWANNFGKKCGEWIINKKEMLSPPPIPEKQHLVGILDGGENVGFADRVYLQLEIPDVVQRTSYLMVAKPGRIDAFNQNVQSILDNPQKFGFEDSQVRFVKLFTFDNLVGELRSHLEFLYQFLAIADGLVIGAVALMSGFLANIYFEQRLGEFGLLSAFGFRRERLARRVVIETGMLVVVGWLLGIGLTWMLFRVLDAAYATPRGLVLAEVDRLAILYTLPIPILVGLSSLATVLSRLYRLDPIGIMERR
ncbi:MAG TPA: ABC transporter permease [Abditibacteriaceae bacterium]|jgi:hypothetical protein|nr:ABC transporter permease [Abditibacteriaceae bacterium]